MTKKKLTNKERARIEAKIREADKHWNTVEGRSIKLRTDNLTGKTHISIPIEYEDDCIRLADVNPSNISVIGAIVEDNNIISFNVLLSNGLAITANYGKNNKTSLESAYQDREWLVESMMKCYNSNWQSIKA